jgi:hypothetical protein
MSTYMKKIIRLTESDLHNIVNESVNRLISEIGRTSYTQKKYDQNTRNEIIANAQAEVDRLRVAISDLTKKIRVAQTPEAKEQLINQRKQLYSLRNKAVSKVWNLSNERVMTKGAKERATIKRRNDRVKSNFYPNYNSSTFTESYIRDVVKEAVNKILTEDGEIGGGGATNCVGINVGGAAGQAKNHIDAPAFGGKNKKKVGGNAFSEPIMRQAHNLGDVTDAPTNQVDMKPALERGGSISMNRKK